LLLELTSYICFLILYRESLPALSLADEQKDVRATPLGVGPTSTDASTGSSTKKPAVADTAKNASWVSSSAATIVGGAATGNPLTAIQDHENFSFNKNPVAAPVPPKLVEKESTLVRKPPPKESRLASPLASPSAQEPNVSAASIGMGSPMETVAVAKPSQEKGEYLGFGEGGFHFSATGTSASSGAKAAVVKDAAAEPSQESLGSNGFIGEGGFHFSVTATGTSASSSAEDAVVKDL